MRFFLFCITACASLFIAYSCDGISSISIYSIYTTLIILSSYFLFKEEKRPFSMIKMFNLFFLFFLSLAPVVQFKSQTRMWGGIPLKEQDYINTGILLIFVWCIVNLIYINTLHKHQKTLFIIKYFNNVRLRNSNPSALFWMFIFGIAIINMIVLFWYMGFNPYMIFFRSEDISTTTQVSSVTALIISNFIRPMNLLMFTLIYLSYPKHKKKAYLIFIIGMITLFPTGAARYSVAATYLPVFLTIVPVFKKKHFFVGVMIVMLLIVWPFLNVFRFLSLMDEAKFTLDYTMFIDGNMDTFSSIVRVIKYDIITYGHQIVGNILFFVPRDFWVEKPSGSSELLADICNLDYENISCNYFAEGYINFGYFGVFLFSLLAAKICAKMDSSYWNIENKSPLYNVFYTMCIGFVIFILRGDLLCSISYLIGYTISLSFLRLIFYKKSYAKTSSN